MLFEKLKILIIGYSKAEIKQLSVDFDRCQKQLVYQQANNLSDIQSLLDTSSWDAIIAEYSMVGFDALQVLQLLKSRHQTIPFILYTSVTDEQITLAALRHGASDCIPKGHSERLMLAIDRCMELVDLQRRKRQADSHIYRMTYYDELTGLPRHNLFCEKANLLLTSGALTDQPVAATYFININRLSRINSKHGYNVGNQLIQQLAGRLSVHSNNNCLLARSEGGNFIFFRSELADTEQAEAFAGQLLALAATPFVINSLEFYITLTIGISLYPHDGKEIGKLLANAEDALSFMKKSWPNTYRFYIQKTSQPLLQRIKIEQSLQKTINDKELVLHYQPIIDLTTGKIIGAEALVRWNHPELGLLTPDQFIPLAVESGSIIKIGKWVLHEACRQAKYWHSIHFKSIFIAINLSAIELDQFQLTNHVAEALHVTELPPAKLELEINESVLMQDIDGSTKILNELKRIGVKIVMDNFGSSYSSLNYLRRLPIDVIKMDHSLIQNITDEIDNTAMITAILALAKELNMQVRAGGVQSQTQLDFLQQINCHHAQGFLLTPPVPLEHFLSLIKHRKTGTFA
ncbi:hypothetical protein Nstercoris_00291 [Nitrosomonas stercoris]|uniref:Signaling protein n=1 Tax=Nitrosomonas stercoris TaxID=1444684 RepID=A0A4Y1YIZ7_9PROT|nr:hypothetical protein Nstercoris_00291 [Nitrosomonas stercoris]